MTQEEIQAADTILGKAYLHETDAKHIAEPYSTEYNNIKSVAVYLKEYGFIEISPSSETYKFLGKAKEYQKAGKKFSDFLEEKNQEEAKKKEKETRDDYHKSLQIRDLETKLDIINKEQLKFWRRQKWHFWLTVILGLLTLYNFFFK